jgi:tetratricopeptide (TPR) repeat protein
MRRSFIVALLAVATTAHAQRISSDFEIAQMKEQIAKSRSFSAQVSGHLNLGDLYAARNERSTSIAEYSQARDIAAAQRRDSRADGDLARYATATSFAALAEAKLGNGTAAFTLAEEAIRYRSDSAETWNLYSSAMSILHKPQKAVSAAQNEVQIAKDPLDVDVYRYSLASALSDAGRNNEAEQLLVTVTNDLRGPRFESLRKEIARSESFEINSSTRGDAAAYLSVLNRTQLRLASLLERRGDVAGARAQYQRVLESRTDDATALAGIARLTKSESDFAAAFDANPFSLPLIRDYQRFIASNGGAGEDTRAPSTGARMRNLLAQMSRGENRAARESIDGLLKEFPSNETLKLLRRETEGNGDTPAFLTGASGPPRATDLRQLIALFEDERLTPEQRTTLDTLTLESIVTFESANASAGQTVLERGTIEGVPFRFSEPTIFSGTFAANTPLRLTYRILGASGDALLLEPLRLELSR